MSEDYLEQPPWSGLRDGPFPRVETHGELERAEAEWLHTNGSGAYAMSTVTLMHTRRTHGLLVVPMRPPLDRYVILSHADVELEWGGKHYRLWTHQFPDILPTPGYRLLRRFIQDPLPTWVFQIGPSEFEMRLSLVRGQEALVLGYTWRGESAVRLTVRPLMPFRPIRSLMREHGSMMQHVHLRANEVEVQPLAHLPPLVFRHDQGVFVGSPDWWRRFEYAEELHAGRDYIEDMWTPGTFELELVPRRTAYLVAALRQLPRAPAEQLQADTAAFERQLDPGLSHPPAVRGLFVAAQAYCNDACARPSITAGYPGWDAISRDALVALPGLYLARDKLEEAKAVLGELISHQQDGLLSTRLPRAEPGEEPPLPDATLLFLYTAALLTQRTGHEDPFVRQVLHPALVRAFLCIKGGQAPGLYLTADGLLANADEQRPLTWMDAVIGDYVVTPRRGLAIEMQAWWTKGTENLTRLARLYGDLETAVAAERACNMARGAFRECFWCNETAYPFDCVSEERGTAGSWADATVRPNAVIALAVDPMLFDSWQARRIIERTRRELLTPRGLRSLAPGETGYRGHYEGPPEERGSSYHQGTAWTHLLGYFVRASVRLAPDDLELRDELRDYLEDALDNAPVLGQVGQLADGEPPHRARGCPAQAWSVAELTRALVSDLGL
jgi:predicted glycogen debranching enzyme